MPVQITRIRHRWAEKEGFRLERLQGAGEYILLHFLSQAELTWNGQMQLLEAGSLMVLSPQTPHVIHATEPLLHNWMHLSGDVPSLLAAYGLAADTLYRLHDGTAVTELMAGMESEFFARQLFWEELCQARLQELMVLVARDVSCVTPRMTVRVETQERLREIRSRMLTEPWRNWSIAELAQEVHLSESRLHAVYRSIFGIAPKHDLILMKIEKAKRLLAGGLSVQETAEALGYSATSHFIRQFRQVTGITPGQYHDMV